MGAEDGDLWEERVRQSAVDGGAVHARGGGGHGYGELWVWMEAVWCFSAALVVWGYMRQSILFKTVVVAGGIAAFGGAVFLGVTHGTEVRGDTAAPAEVAEVFADAALGVSFRYPAGFQATAFSHDESSDVVLVKQAGKLVKGQNSRWVGRSGGFFSLP